jgi:phytoene synthase
MSESSSALKTAYAYCREVTRREARNFYFAFITLPTLRRTAIYVVYAFARLCDDIADSEQLPNQKVKLLKQTHKNLADAFEGHPEGPIFSALVDVAHKYQIPQEYFDALISGVEMDITKTRYANFEELKHYCYGVSTTVGLICAEILGYKDPMAREYAVDLSLAMQLTNILRDLKEDAAKNRIYLPQDELRHFGYSEVDLRQEVINQQYLELMEFQTQRIREYYLRASKLLPLVPLRSRTCVAILHGFYSKLLDHIQSQNFDVFRETIRLSKREKLFLTWKLWITSFIPQIKRI